MTKQPKLGPTQKAIERLPVGYRLEIRRDANDPDDEEDTLMSMCIYRDTPGKIAKPYRFLWEMGDKDFKERFTNWLNGWADKNG